jgi:ribosome-binding factor A
MSRRTERVARLIQQVVGQIILERINDPRVDPARVSVTRVEVAPDLTSAKVFCSVLGSDAEQRTALRALQHAAGRIQALLHERVQLRFTPVLRFVEDRQFKQSLTTLTLIQQAMDESRQQDEIRQQEQTPAGPQPPAREAGEEPEDPEAVDEDSPEDQA